MPGRTTRPAAAAPGALRAGKRRTTVSVGGAGRLAGRLGATIGAMVTWAEFEGQAPDLAAAGMALIYRSGDGEGLLVTVRGENLPRVNVVNVGVVEGRLFLFVQAGSAKRRDLEDDGRYALHAHVDPQAPSEFSVRGRARLVTDVDLRQRIAKDWFFRVSDSYPLFELHVERVLLGERANADAWPPVYSSWPETR